jgi:hydrogenase nickel incorporation protein HypA/HybF
MHEYSIVQALLNQCEDHAKKNEASKIIKVVLKIGVLSGVEPHLLETAFDTFKEGTICEDATLEMNIQEIIIYCKECKSESQIDDFGLACQNCNSLNVSVVDGEDMYLMSLEML